MASAAQKITQARTSLIFDFPFFGLLAFRLDVIEDPTCETMWTDGARLGYNPVWVDGLTQGQVMAVVCHEVLHAVLGHQWRKGTRNHMKWNYAADLAVNPVVKESGLTLPEPHLFDPQLAGKSVEYIYAQLPDPPMGSGGQGAQDGSGGDQEGGWGNYPGEVREASSDSPSEGEWESAVIEAASEAKKQGKLPASLQGLIKEVTKPKLDWKAIMRRFVQDNARADYTWRQPNRRYLHLGIYLPDARSEQMPPMVVARDTSGSISNPELAAFTGELQSIIDECQPETTYDIQCDAKVQHVVTIDRGDMLTDLTVHGRGGTDFRPVFTYVDEQGIEPACLVFLTDMYGDFPHREPEYPTLWVSTSPGMVAPFGETVYLDLGGGAR